MENNSERNPEERIVISNRRARHEYEVIDVFEAGIVLVGSEVKSLRQAKGNLQDSYAAIVKGEMWLMNMHISPFEQANQFNHDPVRNRKLLLHRSELRRLIGKVSEKGLTLVPLKVYFVRGKAKVQVALAKGKKLYDRREDIKKRDTEREMRRALRR